MIIMLNKLNKFKTIRQITLYAISVIIAISVMFNMAYSKNLGQYGHVFAIIEQNMLDFIQERLLHLQKTGQLQALEDKAKADVKASVLRPKPVGLTTTSQPKVFYYTPTFTLQRDVYDANGKLLYPKGTTANPMDNKTYPQQIRQYHIQLPKWQGHFIFLNGDDTQQLNWAFKMMDKLDKAHAQYKFVLINGNIKDSSELLQSRVYFDQYGNLSSRFGIKHVPSIVTQSGVRFKIQEFDVSHESIRLAKHNDESIGNVKNIKNIKSTKEVSNV